MVVGTHSLTCMDPPAPPAVVNASGPARLKDRSNPLLCAEFDAGQNGAPMTARAISVAPRQASPTRVTPESCGTTHDRPMAFMSCEYQTGRRLLTLAACLTLFGCASLLPRSTDETRMTWREFDEARLAIEQITPYQTHRAELLSDGFDPYRNPAVTILSWPELLQKFATAEIVKTGILDSGLQECLAAGRRCTGLSISVRRIERQRRGNFWLDSLSFRREVLVTGWTFNALIVFLDDLVIYRAYGGQPKVEEVSVTRNPLGPIQAWGDSVGGLIRR